MINGLITMKLCKQQPYSAKSNSFEGTAHALWDAIKTLQSASMSLIVSYPQERNNVMESQLIKVDLHMMKQWLCTKQPKTVAEILAGTAKNLV